MVKQRMTALDVRASVEEMRKELSGLRLLNIYDISSKMFLFKFGHGENKKMLLLESGVRMHLTQLVREKPKVPSQFTLKLRKHVRAWRLDSVMQLQHDRTVDFRFGVTEGASYHIIIELFAKGNIVLTDSEYRIMLLHRTHRDDDIKMFVRELYPVTGSFGERGAEELHGKPQSVEEQRAQRTEALRREWNAVFSRHADYETTRSTLSAVHHFGPALADHILTVAGVKSVKKGDMKCSGEEMFTLLLPGMLQAWEIAFSDLPPGGYLIIAAKGRKGHKGTVLDAPSQQQQQQRAIGKGEGETSFSDSAQPLQTVQYDDFSPVLLAQYHGDGVMTTFLPNFGSVCDAFFLYTETEKIDQHNEKKTTSVLSKKEKFERDHKRRISALERDQEENRRKGELIIQNAEKIDEAIGLINGALAAGIQWDALRRLLKQRHAEGHPVAYMVHDLFLERNSISVLVEISDYESQSDEKEEDCDMEACVIEVDLSKTAYANASVYFTKKKANRAKLDKTVASTAKAMAGAEKKGERLSAKQQTKKAIVKERRRWWWEKFSWFRTACGDLVLQGKDTQTTEILVRRVMQLGDIFVSCDIDGAFPCILRAVWSSWAANMGEDGDESVEKRGMRAVPLHLTSLDEAGAWCVSRSSAWESKFSVGAWWVHASQITGGTAAGCYIFEGEKHYLRPQPLTLACGILFCVSSRSNGPCDLEEFPNILPSNDESSFLPADSATALHVLPSVEEIRGPRRRPQQISSNSRKQVPSATIPPDAKTTTTAAEAEAVAGAEGTARTCGAAKGNPQLTKYQRKKLKKIQHKYKDQDDEDRLQGALLNGNQLSMVQQELLVLEGKRDKHRDPASLPSLPPTVTQTATKEDLNDSSGDDENQELEMKVVPPLEDGDEVGDYRHTSFSGTNKPEGHEQQQRRQQTSWQSHVADAAASVEATRSAYDAELRREWWSITSQPQPADKIEYAVAVCAPMSSVISYKYRAELSWGTSKKGQVASSLLLHFTQLLSADTNTSEAHAVRSLDTNDVMEQLRGNLKRLNTGRASKA